MISEHNTKEELIEAIKDADLIMALNEENPDQQILVYGYTFIKSQLREATFGRPQRDPRIVNLYIDFKSDLELLSQICNEVKGTCLLDPNNPTIVTVRTALSEKSILAKVRNRPYLAIALSEIAKELGIEDFTPVDAKNLFESILIESLTADIKAIAKRNEV